MFESPVLDGPVPVAPGPDAAGWLASFDPASSDTAALLDAQTIVQGLFAWLAGREASILAGLQAQAVRAAAADPLDKGWLAEEVGVVMGLRGDFAASRMAAADQLVRRLPDTHRLLAAGIVSPVQAGDLADAVIGLDDEACADVEARVLVRVADQTSTQFRRSLARAVAAVAPKRACQNVCVSRWSDRLG